MKVHLLAITPQAQKVIESAGRTAYQSFDKQGLGTDEKFIRMLIRMGHESVLEHASATFRFSGFSRAFTHQIVRHRVASFTQSSQRYVNEQEFGYVIPDSVTTNPEAKLKFDSFMDLARQTYADLQKMGIHNEDARFVLPNAVTSEIVVTANFREWRHICMIRGHKGAQWEIRRAVVEVLNLLKQEAQAAFADLEMADDSKSIVKVEMAR